MTSAGASSIRGAEERSGSFARKHCMQIGALAPSKRHLLRLLGAIGGRELFSRPIGSEFNWMIDSRAPIGCSENSITHAGALSARQAAEEWRLPAPSRNLDLHAFRVSEPATCLAASLIVARLIDRPLRLRLCAASGARTPTNRRVMERCFAQNPFSALPSRWAEPREIFSPIKWLPTLNRYLNFPRETSSARGYVTPKSWAPARVAADVALARPKMKCSEGAEPEISQLSLIVSLIIFWPLHHFPLPASVAKQTAHLSDWQRSVLARVHLVCVPATRLRRRTMMRRRSDWQIRALLGPETLWPLALVLRWRTGGAEAVRAPKVSPYCTARQPAARAWKQFDSRDCDTGETMSTF